MPPSRRTTTRHVDLLREQFENGVILLAAEFQRNSVWPRVAKAHLVDSVLKNRPIPALLFHRKTSGQKAGTKYVVVDGQQRLRAVLDFLSNRFALTEGEGKSLAGKRFRQLNAKQRERILEYDFVIEELSGYSDAEIRDIFARVNKYTVRLNNQELRHAKKKGKFAAACEVVGGWAYWAENGVFTKAQIARMKPAEFAAELFILLAEGPQDKKSSIDIWYAHYRNAFPGGARLSSRLDTYLEWIASTLEPMRSTRYRKHVDLYALVGALDRATEEGTLLDAIDTDKARSALMKFEKQLESVVKTQKANRIPKRIEAEAARYLVAASRQTDNLKPRTTRIEILERMLAASMSR